SSRIIYPKGFVLRTAKDFEGAAPARVVVFPRLDREQHADLAIGVDSKNGDVRVDVGLEKDAGRLPRPIRILLVEPDVDPGAIVGREMAPQQGQSRVRRAGGWSDQRRNRERQRAVHESSEMDRAGTERKGRGYATRLE